MHNKNHRKKINTEDTDILRIKVVLSERDISRLGATKDSLESAIADHLNSGFQIQGDDGIKKNMSFLGCFEVEIEVKNAN